MTVSEQLEESIILLKLVIYMQYVGKQNAKNLLSKKKNAKDFTGTNTRVNQDCHRERESLFTDPL